MAGCGRPQDHRWADWMFSASVGEVIRPCWRCGQFERAEHAAERLWAQFAVLAGAVYDTDAEFGPEPLDSRVDRLTGQLLAVVADERNRLTIFAADQTMPAGDALDAPDESAAGTDPDTFTIPITEPKDHDHE